jgi:5'(3')-deoxyribonucleotidase
VVLFDQPWNRNLTGFERAYGWEDAPRKLARLLP